MRTSALTLTSILFCLVSCANDRKAISLSYAPKVPQFSLPEVAGEEGSGSFSLSTSENNSPRYYYATLDTNNNLNTQVSFRETGRISSLHLSFGILDDTDFFAQFPSKDYLPTIIGFKTQFIGSTRSALETGHKATFSLQLGGSTLRDNIDTTISSEQRIDKIGATLNYGYRFNTYFLTYINTFYNYDEISGHLFFNRSSVYTHNSSSQTIGILAGVQFTSPIIDKFYKGSFLALEAGSAQTKWSVIGEKTYSPVGASIGIVW